MYSVVLMMAMTAAPEAPNCFFHHSCYSSCYSSCYGCYSSCYGWHGSCYGYVPYSYSCSGYGIYGGASYTWPTPYYGGCGGCYGYGTPVAPATIVPEKAPPPKKTTYLPVPPDQARVIVRLPADAKLFANEQLTNLNTDERWFNTPSLEKGRDFQYTMKVEYVRDGKTVTDKQVVKVRAGETSIVQFADTASTSLATSTIKVIVPENAKVVVENKQELASGVREYKTPQLPKGAQFAYSFRAELTKDGKKQTQTQRVIFKAGEPVTVDFTDMDSPRTASK
jgi:uncharacterized protein (TIGR03000 family)